MMNDPLTRSCPFTLNVRSPTVTAPEPLSCPRGILTELKSCALLTAGLRGERCTTKNANSPSTTRLPSTILPMILIFGDNRYAPRGGGGGVVRVVNEVCGGLAWGSTDWPTGCVTGAVGPGGAPETGSACGELPIVSKRGGTLTEVAPRFVLSPTLVRRI